MADEAGDRTEQATPKKREDARRKGQVVKSTEVTSVAILLGGIATLYAWGRDILTGVLNLIRDVLKESGSITLTPDAVPSYAIEGLAAITWILLPFMLTLAMVSLGINLLQVGFIFSWDSIKPKGSKFNPIKGLSKIFSQETVVSLIREPIKVGIIGIVGYYTIRDAYEDLLLLPDQDIDQILIAIGDNVVTVVMGTSFALVSMAVADYAYRYWKHEKDLRMSKQDIRDESKQQDGNPEIKSKIRSLQQSASRKRMLDAVPDADVVITNPTHLAVAIRYNSDEEGAPRVIAKGARHLAMRIREIAGENEVPIVENKPVARALYHHVEVDQEIPVDMYQAVAEILAFVYDLKPGSRPTGV